MRDTRTEVAPGIRFDRVSLALATGRGAPVPVVQDIGFTVPEGRFTALLGPSGCGKTTLLRLADGLIAPDAGRVTVFDGPPRPGPGIGFVFQSFRLIPWATVAANVEFAVQGIGLDRAHRAERVRRSLDLVGLSRVADAYPGSLSGGMKQRVALARALAPEPRALLMDEPFASLDAQTRELMQVELMRICAARVATVLFVTHSVDEALMLADEIVLLGPNPGRVIEVLPVPLERPRWARDLRGDRRFTDLRAYLADQLRRLVFADPNSAFFGRDLPGPD